MAKQIKFKDIENDAICGGILLDDGNVVCGCCGGIFEASEQGETWQMIREYSNWINLTEEICGDNLEEDEFK